MQTAKKGGFSLTLTNVVIKESQFFNLGFFFIVGFVIFTVYFRNWLQAIVDGSLRSPSS